MEENNTQNTQNEDVKSNEKPVKDKKEKKNDSKKSGNFISEHKAEFRKIVWPSRKELLKETATVIVISLFVGAIIIAMDYAYGFGFSQLFSLMA